MTFELWAGGGAAILLLAAFAFTVRSMLASRHEGEHAASALSDVRVDKYRPIARLMSSDDLEFLRSQPGFVPSMERRFRAQRRGLMRQYLREMESDFNAIYRGATHLLMLAPVDQPELVAQLSSQRWTFARRIAIVRFNLCLDTLGVRPVEVGGLLESFSSVQRQFAALSEMTLAPAAMSA